MLLTFTIANTILLLIILKKQFDMSELGQEISSKVAAAQVAIDNFQQKVATGLAAFQAKLDAATANGLSADEVVTIKADLDTLISDVNDTKFPALGDEVAEEAPTGGTETPAVDNGGEVTAPGE
jgi:hypothetical protein